jgi:hypothetical protein
LLLRDELDIQKEGTNILCVCVDVLDMMMQETKEAAKPKIVL